MARVEIPAGDGDEIIRVWGSNPEMGMVAAVFSAKAYEKSRIAMRERELVRMRVAQLNDCPT